MQSDQSLSPWHRDAFIENNEVLHGCSGLENYASVTDWLNQQRLNEHEDSVQEGFVPAVTYCLVDSKKETLIGMINIRKTLNDILLKWSGHIGYSIHPNHRNQGHAKTMLKDALDVCQSLNMTRILISADEANCASWKVIEACGGQLENTVLHEDMWIRRYWIELK